MKNYITVFLPAMPGDDTEDQPASPPKTRGPLFPGCFLKAVPSSTWANADTTGLQWPFPPFPRGPASSTASRGTRIPHSQTPEEPRGP
jgi:hypothetical protein